MTQNQTLAGAILIGFILIATAIFFSSERTSMAVVDTEDGVEVSVLRTGENVWTYGEKGSATTIVEFSDYECPFCARLHPTLKKLVDESNGDINWQFRHFPIPSHRNAELAAKASECVGNLKGNSSFWEFTDTLFANQKSINSTFIKQTALELGLDENDFDDCVIDKSIEDQVANDLATVRALGGSGTPFSVIVKADGSVTPVRGALQYESWITLLNQ